MLKNNKSIKGGFFLLTVLYILITSFFIGGILIDQTRLFHKGNIEFESHKYDLKSAGIYTNITIDDSPGSPNNWVWAKTQPWVTGSGTLLDPYIIEGHTLKMFGRDGISIINSNSSYFTIRNCNLTWDTSQTNSVFMTGIFLSNTSKGQIINNTIYYLGKGIHLNLTQGVQIVNNTIYDHPQEGILLEYSRDINIFKNKINDTSNGISLFYSNNTVIYNNSVYSNLNGIEVSNSYFNEIYENIAYNNDDGILVLYSENNTLEENKLNNNFDNGMNINNGHNNTILENEISSNTQTGIYMDNSHNNTIAKNEIKDNTLDGIFVSNSDDNIISGNEIQNNDDGIHLTNSQFNSLSENSIYNNTQHGVYLNNGDLNVIVDNPTWDNGENGINFVQSQNNVISDSYIYNNGLHGISLDSVSDGNNISKNRIYDNTENGILLNNSFTLTIWDNNIYNNGLNGILSYNSEYGNFYGNIIHNNSYRGVYLDPTTYANVFYENFFLRNGKHAVDDENSNNWNSTTIGNYWDNHTGPDTTPNDGIVDVPYAYIGGSAGNIDFFPIADDTPPIIIINSPYPGDLFASTAPSFNVKVTDKYLDSMWYTLDGGIQNFTFTANGTIDQTEWDYLSSGNINLQFFASDKPGNIATASVIIEKDVEGPVITKNSPYPGDAFSSNAPSFNVRITDSHLDTMWYTLDGGLHNFTFTVNGTIDQSAWNTITDGAVTLTFYANDTLANLASAEITIIKDTQAPIITIHSPTDGEVFNATASSFDITIVESNLDTVWYSLDGGLNNYSISVFTGTIDQSVWDALSQGEVTITIYANDTAGNLAFEEVTIILRIPAAGGIGIDYFMTSFLLILIGGMAVIIVITRMYSKRKLIS